VRPFLFYVVDALFILVLSVLFAVVVVAFTVAATALLGKLLT
jgi:hypothetical protein